MIFWGFWEDFRNSFLRFFRDFGRILGIDFLRFSGDFRRILGIVFYDFWGILGGF